MILLQVAQDALAESVAKVVFLYQNSKQMMVFYNKIVILCLISHQTVMCNYCYHNAND